MSSNNTILIRGATVLSMDPAVGDFERADILVRDGVIEAVGPDLALDGDAERDIEVIDADRCIVIPGFVDTHRHMWEAVLRGSAPHHTLWNYFEHTLGQVGPGIGPDDAYVGELLSALGAVESGITTIQDISNIQATPEHSDSVVQALQDSGMRARWSYCKPLPVMYFEGSALPDDVRRLRSKTLFDSSALVTMALDTETGDEAIEQHNAALADELDLPITRHISTEWPLRDLEKYGVMRPGATYIHGNGIAVDDLKLIADTGGSLSVAPAIELMMGFGLPWTGPAVDAGLLITLSVDIEVTCASDMFMQMRSAYQAARHAHLQLEQTGVSVKDVLAFATINGAKSLGLGDRTGSITPGKEADLVVLRADRPGVFPVYDPYSTVVLQMDRSHVDAVLVRGRFLKRDGRLVHDIAPLLDRADAISRRIKASGVLELPGG